jgi:hypothetical protein
MSHSVLYVSLGSFLSVSAAQFDEIAGGLAKSKARFRRCFYAIISPSYPAASACDLLSLLLQQASSPPVKLPEPA